MADLPQPIKRRSMLQRVRAVLTGGAGGLASGAAKGAYLGDPHLVALAALGDAASELIQAVVAEAADSGISLDNQQVLERFGRLVEQQAQRIPDSEDILHELASSTGRDTSNINLYSHALKSVGARSGAAQEAMLLGLARSIFEQSEDVNPSALRRSMEVITQMTDDQIALLALLSDAHNPLSELSMSVAPVPGQIETYGEHLDEVVLLMHEVLTMVDRRLIVQYVDLLPGETLRQYEKRAVGQAGRPQAMHEVRLHEIRLAPLGATIARQLGLRQLDPGLQRRLREQLDPNGVVLDDISKDMAACIEQDGPAARESLDL